MNNHEDERISFGSDRAELVYGQTPVGALVHVTVVRRGLACGCICPACKRPLVAKTKADKVVPHFAHHGPACGGGPETALHLLAKEVFRASPLMLLPERPALDERKQVVTKPSQEVRAEFLRLEYTDPKKIIPDLYVRALGYDLFVEVAVTHFSDETKVQRLRDHRTPAVEVDLSRLPRDSTREAIADAVLRSAPRRWLYHPGIDVARAKLRADEEKWHAALNKRQAEATAKHYQRVDELVGSYGKALRHLGGMSAAVPRYAELQTVGLREHVGVEVNGYGCFTQPPAVWQAIILTQVFHDRCLGDGVCKAVPIAGHLEKASLIRPPFRRVSREVADDVAAVEMRFAPPWKAVDAYLGHLVGAGVLVPHGYGFALSAPIAERWTELTLAEKKRTAVTHAAVQAVEWILGELPDDVRHGMTGDTWLESVHAESGMTYRAALQSDIEAPKIAAEIDGIVAMLAKRGPLPYGTVGLPIEGAIEHRKLQMAADAGRQREKQIREASRLRQHRRDRLCIDAEMELSGSDLDSFLNTHHPDLKGMTPLEAAEDSEAGLSRARELLADVMRKRARYAEAAAERKRYQDKITADAKRLLAAEHSDAFLNGRDDDLGRTTPLLFVRDESSYRRALGKLVEWERAFRQPF